MEAALRETVKDVPLFVIRCITRYAATPHPTALLMKDFLGSLHEDFQSPNNPRSYLHYTHYQQRHHCFKMFDAFTADGILSGCWTYTELLYKRLDDY